MDRVAQAGLVAAVAVFAFDLEPSAPPRRALRILACDDQLPASELLESERFPEAAARVMAGAGLGAAGRRRQPGARLRLVCIDDEPSRPRAVTAVYLATAPLGPVAEGCEWKVAGRGLRLHGRHGSLASAAGERLRAEARYVAGAAGLVGDVLTADDLLRVQIAVGGGPRGSDRTFRRRIQELRQEGVLRSLRASETAELRRTVPRFRSSPGTGGRPPELLRYSGRGGEDEPLTGLRARRTG